MGQKTSAGVVGDIGHDRYYEVMEERFDRCEAEYLQYRIELWENVPRCHQSRRVELPSVAFYGDSHAEQLFWGQRRFSIKPLFISFVVVSLFWVTIGLRGR